MLALAMPFGSARGGDTITTPDITEMDYSPIGSYEPGDLIPAADQPPTDPNPSGKWVAYDNNVFVTLALPDRQAGDTSDDDPAGSGMPVYGVCPPADLELAPYGDCANHQLEYLDYFERAMRDIFGGFGVTVQRYAFDSLGGFRGAYAGTPSGRSINITATIPGAVDPEKSIIIGTHFDNTDSGPTPAWDSTDGSGVVIRLAAILGDYWRKTGTRPAHTVRFAAWDAEESGLVGSSDFVDRIVPPGRHEEILGYFNMDPCSGAYPAPYRGNHAYQVPEILHVADPEAVEDAKTKSRIERFNARAAGIVEEVFDHLDDSLVVAPGVELPIFVSDSEADGATPSQQDKVVMSTAGIGAGSSDWAPFARAGVPIFDLIPHHFGPLSNGGPPSTGEGLGIIHTPRDNLATVNALTSADQSGLTVSEGWAKSMEMCAHLIGWYALQPEMGGAALVNDEPVAFFEALPNEAAPREPVRFDARGSIGRGLEYRWDFGDGEKGRGPVVRHRYELPGRYVSRLTVSGEGGTHSMRVPVEVIGSDLAGPLLETRSGSDEDGSFTLRWTYDDEHEAFVVEESESFDHLLDEKAEGDPAERWTVTGDSDPRLHLWQPSDSDQQKIHGNQANGGEASFWTGTFPTTPSPMNLESILELKEPVSIPNRGEAILSFFSSWGNESDDSGRVEVAIDDGDDRTPLRWTTELIETGTWSPGDDPPPFNRRFVDLTEYRGYDLRLRFRFVLGPTDPVLSQPAGWYVDDITLGIGGWREIGRTKRDRFLVEDRTRGTYGYRVRAVLPGGITTSASNSIVMRVDPGVTVRGRSSERRGPLPATGAAASLGGLALLGLSWRESRALRRAR